MFINTVVFHRVEENIVNLVNDNGIVRVELWIPNEYIGKRLRQKLEQAKRAVVTIITEEKQLAGHAFPTQE